MHTRLTLSSVSFSWSMPESFAGPPGTIPMICPHARTHKRRLMRQATVAAARDIEAVVGGAHAEIRHAAARRAAERSMQSAKHGDLLSARVLAREQLDADARRAARAGHPAPQSQL